jgi:hypothetical protein
MRHFCLKKSLCGMWWEKTLVNCSRPCRVRTSGSVSSQGKENMLKIEETMNTKHKYDRFHYYIFFKKCFFAQKINSNSFSYNCFSCFPIICKQLYEVIWRECICYTKINMLEFILQGSH